MNYDLFYNPRFVFSDSLGNERKCYNAEDVVVVIDRFINENFRGLAEITWDLPRDVEIFVSIESFAMFFKDVIAFIFGRALLKMHFYHKFDKMYLKFDSVPKLKCKNEENYRFLKLARDVGFDIDWSKEEFLLTVDTTVKHRYSLYVPTVKDNAKKIEEIFENVFYSDTEFVKRFLSE